MSIVQWLFARNHHISSFKAFNLFLRTRNNPDLEELPDPFTDPNFGEALRFLLIEFKILAIGNVSESYPYPNRPPVHFRGRIILHEDAEHNVVEAQESNIVGTVTMTGDGEVRWSFVSSSSRERRSI